MPTGLIHDENGMGAGSDGGADLRQMGIHRVGVAPRQHQADGLAPGRTNGAEDIGPLGALIVWCPGSGSAPRPAARDLVFLAYTGFVLEPDFDLRPRLETGADRCDFRGEVFLKASTANSFCA